jgi:Recombination endonuclease VII
MSVVLPDERDALVARLAAPRRARAVPNDRVAELRALADSLHADDPDWRRRTRRARPLWAHWPNCRHRNYHLTCQEFEMLDQEAGGFCDICGEDYHSSGRALHIDHDHAIGWRAVRGMLCRSCNGILTSIDQRLTAPDRAAVYYLDNPWHGRVGLERLTCPDDCKIYIHHGYIPPTGVRYDRRAEALPRRHRRDAQRWHLLDLDRLDRKAE